MPPTQTTNNPPPMTTMPPPPSAQSGSGGGHIGAVVGAVVIVALLSAGGAYFWWTQNERAKDASLNSMGEQEDSRTKQLEQTSGSDSISDLQADLNASSETYLDSEVSGLEQSF